jgi:hypothetical protein
MKPQIGKLSHQGLAMGLGGVGCHVLAGHHRFGGFLAHLLEDGVGALVEQSGHIACVGVTAFA